VRKHPFRGASRGEVGGKARENEYECAAGNDVHSAARTIDVGSKQKLPRKRIVRDDTFLASTVDPPAVDRPVGASFALERDLAEDAPARRVDDTNPSQE